MATEKINTREEIICKGSELIHAQGYKATGIQQILDVVKVDTKVLNDEILITLECRSLGNVRRRHFKLFIYDQLS